MLAHMIFNPYTTTFFVLLKQLNIKTNDLSKKCLVKSNLPSWQCFRKSIKNKY